MKLYLVLLPLLLLSQNNLWSWKITTTMTKTEIAEQLQAKRAALTALLEKNNLSLETVLSTQQLAIVEQVDVVLGMEEAPQDIGKKAFVEYVEDWVRDFIIILDEKRESDVKMEVKDIIRSLREQIKKIDFPISTILWKKLKAEIDALPSPTTPEELRQALLSGFKSFNSEMGNKFILTKHYKENKATYKKVKEEQLNSQIMIADDFEAWLNKAIEEGKELEKEQEAFEKEAREKQEALEKEKLEEEKAFKEAYAAWKTDQNAQIKHIISEDRGTDSTHNMSKAKFIAILLDHSKGWKEQPELGQEISQSIVNNLRGDSLAIRDYVNAMSYAYSHITTPESTIAKHWYEWRRFFDIAGVLTALITENTGTSQYDIVEEYVQWYGKVAMVVDSLKVSNSRQFITDKLITGLSTTLSTPELNIFLPQLTSNIRAHKKNFLSLKETSEVWKNSLGQLIKNPSALIATQVGTKIDSALLDNLDQVLMGDAGVDTLQRVFQQALRPLPKPDALSKGEFINLVMYLNDGTVLTSRLMTTIDKTDKVPYAYPSSVQLDVSKGKSAYDFEAKPVFDQSPVVRNQEMVTIDFEYTLAFSKSRGSSSGGGEVSVEYTDTNNVEVNRETSTTTGKEETESKGENTTEHWSSTDGLTGTGEGSFFGLFGGSVSLSTEVTEGESTEWTSETSTTDINTTTNTTGVTTGNSKSVANMNKTTWDNTVEHGNDESYLTVKGVLTCADINQETMVLSIENLQFMSPNMKGLAINKVDAQTGKTVRWKK